MVRSSRRDDDAGAIRTRSAKRCTSCGYRVFGWIALAPQQRDATKTRDMVTRIAWVNLRGGLLAVNARYPYRLPMILVCGEALYDLFLADSDPQGVIAIDAWPGGSPFNVAIGLARLGQAVSFFSSISTDVFGEGLVRLLRREGVWDGYLRRSPAPSTLSIVGAGPQGTPHYSFRGDGAADRMILAADLPPKITGVRAIHVGSLATVVRPIGEALRLLVLRE